MKQPAKYNLKTRQRAVRLMLECRAAFVPIHVRFKDCN